MAKSSEYWAERFNLLQESQLNKADQTVADLERVYNRAIASVERDMRDWYARFAVNNEIDLTEAQKLLKGADLSEFKWTLDEYTRAAKASAFDTKYIKQLENASAKVHISRLEALEIQLRQKVEALHTMREDTLETLSRDIFEERYYKSAYETQLGLNIGWDVAKLNDKLIDTVINKPWAPDGINFSKRIWRDRDRLVEKLHTEMTQMIIRGEAPDRVINEISKSFNTSKNVAGRLVMTESAFFASAGQEKAFDDLGVEEFEIVATLDRKTSDLCQSLDGKVVPMKDYAPGVTAPPFHSWCRTTTAPYFEDLGGERIARGVDGETYFVPSDMNYPQWKKVFVDKEITMDAFLAARPSPGSITGAVANIAEFIPAKTTEEATEYAKKFANQVDYGKMSLDHMNAVNKALDEVYSDKLPKMKLIDMRTSKYKGFKNGAMASYDFVYNEMHINSAVLKDKKALDRFVKKIQESEDLIRSIKPEDYSKYSTKQVAFISKYNRIGKELVEGDTINGIIKHEYGHHVDFAYLNKKYDKNEYMAGYMIKGEKLSTYATEQPREYIAESFVAYTRGERDLVDPMLLDMFDEIYE